VGVAWSPAVVAVVWVCAGGLVQAQPAESSAESAGGSPAVDTPGVSSPADPFESYLRAEFPVADGFDFPVGDSDGRGAYLDPASGRSYDGWYVATRFGERYSLGIHPGEDWNGTGGWNTDLGQEVHAVAAGRVAFSGDCGRLWGNVILIDHVFYEHESRRGIRSAYVHLRERRVRAGEVVKRRQPIGSIGRDPEGLYTAHLHWELRSDLTLAPNYWPSSHGRELAWIRAHYEPPTAFVSVRRRLPVPQEEKTLVLVDTRGRRMRLYRNGRAAGTFEVGFGQGIGRKRRQGDLRTPLGMYFVVERSRGPFPGRYGVFYGGYWIKVDYPGAADAAWGRSQGLLSEVQAQRISDTWAARKETWQGSPLGGGIGFHGWAGPWDLAGPRRLSWGCVVMRNEDIAVVFGQIPLGTMVVVF
jgi:murein DD-endopeptidase MepM/ murein hydrolase activator NlpD